MRDDYRETTKERGAKMDKVKIEREAIILDEAENKQLLECLQYCRHRLTAHPRCGLTNGVPVRFVDYMITNLQKGRCNG
jgi:hypothetical protein